MASSKHNLKQHFQHSRSTKPTPLSLILVDEPRTRTNIVITKTITIPDQLSTDQTCRLPFTSSLETKYFIIYYEYDVNAIISISLKSREGPELLRPYKEIYNDLTTRGLKPQIQRLDNEASSNYKQTMKKLQVKSQLVPPHSHRCNPTERSIQTWKYHYIIGMCITDKRFLIHLACRLRSQYDIKLNILRSSRINTNLSAYSQLKGNFDFNATPLAPPETKALIHENPNQRNSWHTHGVSGWYICPVLEYYRCYKVYSVNTCAERVSDIVKTIPSYVSIPHPSSIETSTKAALELTQALLHPSPATSIARYDDVQLRDLEQLKHIFQAALPNNPSDQPTILPKPVSSPTIHIPNIVPTTPTQIIEPIQTTTFCISNIPPITQDDKDTTQINETIQTKTKSISTPLAIDLPIITQKDITSNLQSKRTIWRLRKKT